MTISRDNLKNLLTIPTCNTQEDEVESMEVRADMFYRIGIYSKVFLVFKASIMVKE